MSSVFDNISDLIAIVDLEGRRLYNSPSYRYMLEDPEELQGTDSFMDIHPEDREKVRQAFHEVVRSGKGKLLEYRLMGIGGNVSFIESQSNLLKDAAEEPRGVVIISRDITARKRAEESLLALVGATAKSGDDSSRGSYIISRAIWGSASPLYRNASMQAAIACAPSRTGLMDGRSLRSSMMWQAPPANRC